MGIMTALVQTYIANPFSGFAKGFWNFCEVAGYARAASELSRQGLHKEAKACMMQIKNIRAQR